LTIAAPHLEYIGGVVENFEDSGSTDSALEKRKKR
jgi:hypothetical protein